MTLWLDAQLPPALAQISMAGGALPTDQAPAPAAAIDLPGVN